MQWCYSVSLALCPCPQAPSQLFNVACCEWAYEKCSSTFVHDGRQYLMRLVLCQQILSLCLCNPTEYTHHNYCELGAVIVESLVPHRVMAFNSVMVLISNSSLTKTRGTVNGYAQALGAIGRSIGPVLGATLFAWSENIGKYM